MTDDVNTLPSLDPRSTALLNVHWQHDIVQRSGAFGASFADEIEDGDVIGHGTELLAFARSRGVMVAHARAAYRPGYPDLISNCALFERVAETQSLQEGSPGAEIISEFAPSAGEPILSHARTSAFLGTELDLLLRTRGVRNLIVTGVATNVTVEGSARDAVNLGYRTIIASDACAAADQQAHQATLATFRLLGWAATSSEIEAALELSPRSRDSAAPVAGRP
ncbi:cysteine hydrolase [Nonomuraea monospora]|uniref:Cysteine hydrolase n=1 Tax=Nonomuraea monospora TaxID=568818 RepID=A0ABN3D355_9ACTN